MDIPNAIVDLWELAGEPSDLDPWGVDVVNYDPETELDENSLGVKYYLRQLSRAQITLANWRTRKGRPIRFKKFLTQTNVLVGRDGEANAYPMTYINSYSVRINSPDSALDEDNLADTKIIINGAYTQEGEEKSTAQVSMCVRAVYDEPNDWYTLTLRDEITNVAYTDSEGIEYPFTSYTIEIYWDRFLIERSTAPLYNGTTIEMPYKYRNIMKITGMKDGADLVRAESKANLFNPYMTFGLATSWYNLGEKLYFDTYFQDGGWYTLEYQRLPYNITSLTDTFDIPEEWHEVLLLIVEWQSQKRAQDKQAAAELLASINRWIDTLRTDMEEEWLRENTSGFYIRREARS